MELVVLGSGTVAPSRDRTAPAYWVRAGGVRLLLDCGAGTLHRAAAFGIPWHTVTHVALTHFHPDHWGELPMLLFALRYGIEPARSAPLAVIGPRGLRTRLTLLAGALGDWVLDPGYPCDIQEIAPGAATDLGGGTTLETCKTPHTSESLAYAVRAGDRRLVYTGDTGVSDELARWARSADLLLAECSLPEDRPLDIHLTPRRAGALARAAQARHLVLTHFYPPVEGTDPAGQAADVFGGMVSAARDGDRFVVGAPPAPQG
jgi:ribonuclease BN (tRNA processing enzyme)